MDVGEVLRRLERRGTRRQVEGMARYGIRTADRAFGVPMAGLKKLAKEIGRDHALAAALWKSGAYEAKLLAALVDEPARVTAAQMEAWTRGFDNWATCDTACFHLFDRTQHAWAKLRRWCASSREFTRRAGLALMACLALHDKAAPDRRFAPMLPLIAKAAADERNFVKKAASWALRSIGRRPGLRAPALETAKRLAASSDAPSRWVGKDALRDLSRRAK